MAEHVIGTSLKREMNTYASVADYISVKQNFKSYSSQHENSHRKA